jgi:hypothetical protein
MDSLRTAVRRVIAWIRDHPYEPYDPEQARVDEEEQKRRHWAYGSGPDTLAGDDDL